MVPVSALKGTGVDKLLESVSLEAELLELKAHHKGPAQGVVIESELDKFRGLNIGFIFQSPHFIKSLNINDNLILSQFLLGNKDQNHIDDHIKNIEIENKKLDKLSRMRELENWLDYLNLE